MVLTVSFALSLVSRACCHHRLQDHHLGSLISASGYQDHTTSPSANGAFVLRVIRVHRIPHPTLVTIGQTPLCDRVRDARRSASDLPDVTSEQPATNWHDGQIRATGRKRVKSFWCGQMLSDCFQPIVVHISAVVALVARMSVATCGLPRRAQAPDIASLIRATES